MSASRICTIFAGAAIALSLTGGAGASTINPDNVPSLRGNAEPQAVPESVFAAAIAGDYIEFNASPAFLAGRDDSTADNGISLTFEVTSGYVPEPETVQSISTLVSGS